MNNGKFMELIWQKGRELYRDMPWREDTRAHYVLVSEIMLQQTQVDRVMPKFQQFITAFPDEKSLARSDLANVLRAWQGLGYNRRAKFLHEAAKAIIERGKFPETFDELVKLPGVGKNTARAILAYSFNQPAIFVETNVRTVYIHHFFADNFAVDDKEIIEKLEETVPWAEGKEQPERRIYSAHGAMRKTVGLSYGPKAFYWALMDYGSWLKRNGIRNISSSKHYKKQSALKGSVREVRGQIIKSLGEENLKLNLLKKRVFFDDRFDKALDGLQKDGLIAYSNGEFHLTN